MQSDGSVWVVVGIDNGATCNSATVLDSAGRFLVDELVETPSRVNEGPEAALDAMEESVDGVLHRTGHPRERVRVVGLDTPGPASADGVISARGATNFLHPGWPGYDLRSALERRLRLPVVYNNDGNVAALYAHERYFGDEADRASSASLIVGTGLGGGIVERGRIVRGATGTAGELGHVHIPMEGILEADQPVPRCNCGFEGDAESIESVSGIEKNLLPYWLSRYPDHELAGVEPLWKAARLVRRYGEEGDEMALRIFEQQAAALGRLVTIVANVLDPHAYFVGGGVVEAATEFREWFLGRIRTHASLRDEARATAAFALVPDLDMAGARGSAIAAWAEATEAADEVPD